MSRLTVEEQWRIRRPSGVALAPDGTRAVCALASFSMQENKTSASLWLLPTASGRPRLLTTGGEKDGQPAWSPAGRTIAFVAKREWRGKKDEAPQIYLIDADGGEARRLTALATGVCGIKWFPDGRRIAFVSWVWPELRGEAAQARRMKRHKDDKVKAHRVEHSTYRFWDHWLTDGRVPHLFVCDLRGRARDLFAGTPYELKRAEPDQHCYDISPDGARIAFAFDPAQDKKLDAEFDIVELELGRRRFRNLTPQSARHFHHPRYSPDGTRIACLSNNVRASPVAPNEITLLERGTIQMISRRWDRNVERPLRWSADGAALLCLAQESARQHLFRFDLASRQAQPLARGGMVTEFDLAGERVAFVRDTLGSPPAVFGLDGGAERQLESFNRPLLARLELGQSEEITYRGWRGAPVQMWLVFPPRFNPRRKYPLLHMIHGGPHSIWGDNWHFRWNSHVFAAQGYIVAGVNYHGSSSFGQKFLESIRFEFGRRELADIEAATDLLLKRRYIDRRRLFAAGGSYGGYMVAWMNGHVPAGRYRAYICHAGCFDWMSMIADDAYPYFAKELGAWYWKDPARIEAQNPRAAVRGMATPTLVVHGALDYRVPDSQGLQYYNTLRAKKVPARLLHFPDENHWIMKPQNSRLWHREFFGWLRRFDAARGGGAPS